MSILWEKFFFTSFHGRNLLKDEKIFRWWGGGEVSRRGESELSAHYGKPEVKFSQNLAHERPIGVVHNTLFSCHDISKNSVKHCLKIPFQLALIHGVLF